MTLGEKIKFYRTKLNLSQEELAHKCELSRNAIYNYENSKRNPTISTLELIAHNLNLYVSDLLEDVNDANLYSNRLGILKAIDKDIENNVLADKEKRQVYENEMDELDKNYFFDLFNRRTSLMTPGEYFKFILSLCPLKETNHITEEDIEELSILFYRLLTLKSYERDSLNATEKILPGHSKKYEKYEFVTRNQK
ncbi:helix-turn-helix transcriptional regulator [Clostridium sp. C2-6-12]|uniref:helix-turn-helix domain-containing protein n=1 Tax=Clostridium sp. C2-6-12 TaxID=2698832 RepID=UPI0013686725|nr:helix-turn-helix transcriptional regulator [Clostridium sp. C2-6-12]